MSIGVIIYFGLIYPFLKGKENYSKRHKFFYQSCATFTPWALLETKEELGYTNASSLVPRF